MAHKRKRIFDGLYAQLEETDGNAEETVSVGASEEE